MKPNKYTTKLAAIIDFNPSWLFGAASPVARQNMLGKILSSTLEGERGALLMDAALKIALFSWQDAPLNKDSIQIAAILAEAGANFGAVGEVILALSHIKDVLPNNLSPSSSCEKIEAAFDLLPEFCGKNTVKNRLTAESLLEANAPQATEAVNCLPSAIFGIWKSVAQLRTGSPPTPQELISLWENAFWHPNIVLVLHDLLFPLPRSKKNTPLPPVLLYSWNKKDVLHDTLNSLRESGIADAPVFVLDNGSTDGTNEMLLAQKDTWGTPFHTITLPSNIGAPAARNWLLSLEEVKSATYAVFLDDDVILPPNWLQDLTGVAEALSASGQGPRQGYGQNPGQNPAHTPAGPGSGTRSFGAIGCMVTDHTPPYGIQAADFYLLNESEATKSFEDIDESVFPFCAALGQTNHYLYRYTRPCVSVTGCCHLLNMQAIREAGPFDVRFNPSQFDDFERDLRSGLAGFPTYYHGHLAIKHVQHSSLRQAIKQPQQAHIMGNKLKLEYIYDNTKISCLKNTMFDMARQDILTKAEKICAALKNAYSMPDRGV